MLFNKIHNYPDGNILIDVEDITFKVHSTILTLSSKQFAAMINRNLKETIDDPKIIAHFELKDNVAKHFEDLLSVLYPHTSLVITWENIEYIGSIAHQYQIVAVISRLQEFLDPRWHTKPLYTLVLAEQLNLANEYREASRVVIDELLTVQTDPLFERLGDATKLKLFRRYTQFIAEMKTTMAWGSSVMVTAKHFSQHTPRSPLNYASLYQQYAYSSPSTIWKNVIRGVNCAICGDQFTTILNSIPFVSGPPIGSPLGQQYFLSIDLDLH